TLFASPAWGLGEREVDLHLRAAIAELARAVARARGNLGCIEQPVVELRRCDVRDHCPLGLDRVAAGCPHADGAAGTDDHALDIDACFAGAALPRNGRDERVGDAAT